MPFLGYTPDNTFHTLSKQTITGDGGTSYTLTNPVVGSNDIEVFVNNVRQEPSVAYTATGVSLSFTSAVANTDSVYVIYQGKALGLNTVPDGSVTADKLNSTLDLSGKTISNFATTGTDGNAIRVNYNGVSTSGGPALYWSYDGTTVGSVSVNSSGTTYNTTSDRRLKENIVAIADGKDRLLAMKPCEFSFKADDDHNMVTGFIAQEMKEVVPEAVTGEDGDERMMSMDYGRITPVIVAALQDALKEIEELKTRIKTLEAK